MREGQQTHKIHRLFVAYLQRVKETSIEYLFLILRGSFDLDPIEFLRPRHASCLRRFF